MNDLKNADGKLVIAGLGAPAIFGPVIVAAVVYANLNGLGLNGELAWALSMIAWIAVVAYYIYRIINFYNSTNSKAGQVTTVRNAPPLQHAPTVEPEPRRFPDEPTPVAAPSTSYRDMLKDRKKNG